MPFNTISYCIFLPVIFLIHYFSPDRFRWLVLLVASFLFYSALKAPHLLAVLLLVTTISYFTGIWINSYEDQRSKRYILWVGISANVITLILLKYLPFLATNLNLLLNQIYPGSQVPVSNAIIAIGVSYFIFQAISYLIDIYLEIEKPELHFGHFALYMSFFPKLLQGPIERAGNLLPQFKKAYIFDYDNVRSGMLIFTIGLVKKIVVADRLAMMVNPVFANVHAYNGFQLLLATYCYALQIYFDFSGYTDMALGAARMFNINLTQNFNNPYFATSIADFWRRWHISFSSWILDYIFKPLQMSWRNWGSWGIAAALLVTFVVSGLWHGASWGFVVWGGLHGLYMAMYSIYRPYQKRITNYFRINKKSLVYRSVCVFIVFNMVSFAWIFFRTASLEEALYVAKAGYYGSMVLLSNTSIIDAMSGKFNLSIGTGFFNISIIAFAIFISYFLSESLYISKIYRLKAAYRYLVYNVLILTVILSLIYSDGVKPGFIYMDF